ncbi:hypothetical protein Poly24_53860 [Rosistilla carotiformis]|uniref:SseB protein N-terminal domain-containing protein n=1 Tax=Rosistilla carotiformis TaxID=2528017 RepID=A0A518K1K0_9BACT|nr:hypothetical protein [Rosistilla carotiformis]QDV71647.1 hypothetical protein Poly24_53860 [Rosistilla carotiformis]
MDDLSSESVNLQPWLLLSDAGPACWQMQDDRIALAMFTDQAKAEQYANDAQLQNSQCLQPSPIDLVRTMAMCVEGAIEVAVLDPDQKSARRVFDLPVILKKVRDDLRAGKPLTW